MTSKWWMAAAMVMVVSGSAGAENFCGELANAYGPFDYRARAAHSYEFNLVEHAHFTSDVENGIKGSTSEIGGDLDYTLRAIPNHHRALATMARYAVRTKAIQLGHAKYPVECYFDRAMRYAPDDGAVLAEYGNYLFALGRTEKAFGLYRAAVNLSPENATINYNVGLAYFTHKDYDNALMHAQKAYAAGYPLPGLKKKLIDAGKWVEPVKKATSEPAAAQPAAAETSEQPAK
jgi:tetratricopeptide (TPR) repeat protein